MRRWTCEYNSAIWLSFLDTLPIDKAEIKSSDLKQAIGAQSLSRPTWKRIVECFTAHRRLSSGGSETIWKREGHSVVRVTAEAFGFKAETA
jgi:hypothetical protein